MNIIIIIIVVVVVVIIIITEDCIIPIVYLFQVMFIFQGFRTPSCT